MMTIERLESYRGMLADSKAIQEQIKNLEMLTIKGANMSSRHSKEPSNPTERTAMHIVALKERLFEHHQRMLIELQEITEWIETIEDGELRAIIREHYCNGLSWNKTNMKVFGFYSYDTSRKRVERYFAK